MVERLPMAVRVLLGLGISALLTGAVLWGVWGPVVHGALVVLGVLCLVAALVRHRRRPPPPAHTIHEELQEAYEARMIVGAVVTAVTWTGIVVALFLTGHHALGAVFLAMLIVAPLLAYYLATSATRTHRRRSKGRVG